jgi:peptidoglycan/LPS O-acetylase OafA/YrhL
MARNALAGREEEAFILADKVPASATDRNPGLDMLRALAALAVFLFHFKLFGEGWLGVQVFFVISGYLITQSIESRPGVPRRRILAFYGRRIRRILPPLYIYLLLIAPTVFLSHRTLIKGWLASLTFTYNFYHLLPYYEHSRLLTHTWSLGVEEQFYLVFPFLLVLWRRNATLALLLVVAIEPLIRWQFGHFLARSDEDTGLAIYVAGFTQLDSFAIGALLWLHRARVKHLANWGTIGAVFALTIAFGELASATRDGALWLAFPVGAQAVWGYSLVALLSGLVVVRLSRVEQGGAALRGLALLGFYSYEFYILHYPVRELSLRFFPVTPLGNLEAAIVALPVIVLLAVGLHFAGLQVVALIRTRTTASSTSSPR